MPIEIERKFLVDKASWELLQKPSPRYIVQGYLFNTGNKSCRIRVVDNSIAVLNIKQEIDALHRHEVEVQIPLDEAKLLLANMAEGFIEKQRYEFSYGDLVWEVDVFTGNNFGLIVAEVELLDANILFEKPDWIAAEVTHDRRYLNTNLAFKPFSSW